MLLCLPLEFRECFDSLYVRWEIVESVLSIVQWGRLIE